MSQVFDPDNAYWAAMRDQRAFEPAWNAALWEAHKAVMESGSRSEALALLRALALRGRETNGSVTYTVTVAGDSDDDSRDIPLT